MAAESYLLQSKLTAGEVSVVTATYDVTGKLKVNPTGKNPLELPLSVAGKFHYAERTIALSAGNSRAAQTLRAYDQANAKIQAGDFRDNVTLRDERQQVACWLAGKHPLLYSPNGPLTRAELDLVAIPANSAILPALLPGEKKSPGDRWKHAPALVAELLGLDSVGATDVESTFREVKSGFALVEMAGTASGTIVGVTSDIELRARYSVDLDRGQIVFFALALREERAMGQFEPGVSAQATVRVEIEPGEVVPGVNDKVAAALPETPDLADTLLDFSSATGEFALLLNRHWHVTNDDRFVTILRLENEGELIAQCNITRASDVAADKRVTLPQFKIDVQKALAERFGEFAAATEETTDTKLHVLRVVAIGTVQEVPIQWIYYHVTSPEGRRVAFVVTLKGEQIEDLAAADESLVSSLRFLERKTPTPAADPMVVPSATVPKPTESR